MVSVFTKVNREAINKFLHVKMLLMKRILSIFSIAAVMAACNNDQDKIMAESAKLKAYQDSVRLAADTAGLAEYQAWKMQNELTTADPYATTAGVAAASAPVFRTYAPARSSSSSRGYSTARRSSGSSGSGTVAQAPAKKGWSKAAKGAVIGGVVGAGAGAVINKKNRGVGAVVGGVLGAGAGYGIGRGMDKRDGRY